METETLAMVNVGVIIVRALLCGVGALAVASIPVFFLAIHSKLGRIEKLLARRGLEAQERQ